MPRYNADMNEAVTAAADVLANTLCLCMALRLMDRRVRPLRVAAAALLGAGIACAARSFGQSGPKAALTWLPAALLMARVACGRGRTALRGALLLLAAEGLLGGTVLALCGATGSLAAAWGVGAAAFLCMALFMLRARRAARDVARTRFTCTVHGRTASFDAIIDSGNGLRDYLTHRPVVVLPETSARRALALGEDALLRPILADTAGGRQMMGCLTPERAALRAQGKWIPARCVLALSPGLSPDAPALVPMALLQN